MDLPVKEPFGAERVTEPVPVRTWAVTPTPTPAAGSTMSAPKTYHQVASNLGCKTPEHLPGFTKKKSKTRHYNISCRSHCDCDIRFYSCLKRVNTAVSRQMGISYFSVLGPQCFRLEKPIIYCAIVHRERCIRYELAQEAPLEYQWFDLPKF